ncbi:MAG: hypothetical protein JWQ40_2115 [Segetibacter sp.]|nr:hypothetical protein [Segetibacter sp.]
MKKQFTTAITKKAFTFLVALVIIFCSTQQSFAFADRSGSEIKTAEITYSGVKDKALIFKVDYKNESSENFQLIIRNEQNDIIYARKYDGKPLNTDIYLSDVPEDCKLTFVIRSGKKEFSQAFAINTSVKTVSELEVKGL